MSMTMTTHGTRQVLSPDEADVRLVEIEKGQLLAGHFPDAEALDRARRILIGEITPDEAYAEIDAKLYE
jgi:hypothetical protein